MFPRTHRHCTNRSLSCWPLLLQAVPDLDQHAECRLRRDEVLALAAPVASFVHHPDAVAFEPLAGGVEILEVDRNMMHPLAVARDELADEVVLDFVRRARDEFELEAGDLEMAKGEVARGIAEVRLVGNFRAGKVAHEK